MQVSLAGEGIIFSDVTPGPAGVECNVSLLHHFSRMLRLNTIRVQR